ncbi:Piso0_005213 [Millerozyma farinosa CBS 7064]|uniref:Piso0_005213 protein n=1 Tax=Pichia sorbitophila (strain ATCC MYA-4447 / BCRC 22081 / CBS 7064 / NBRC 10061 / NRRL Y-12695) TaxID=559304 RepID=G8Y1K4_PICSO|nr:Piso0_005213 [Millerozyma farinosa CBS 7064]
MGNNCKTGSARSQYLSLGAYCSKSCPVCSTHQALHYVTFAPSPMGDSDRLWIHWLHFSGEKFILYVLAPYIAHSNVTTRLRWDAAQPLVLSRHISASRM